MTGDFFDVSGEFFGDLRRSMRLVECWQWFMSESIIGQNVYIKRLNSSSSELKGHISDGDRLAQRRHPSVPSLKLMEKNVN